ncbi:MAG: hypothetical protein U0939_22510 [Pirellulales bacterium]
MAKRSRSQTPASVFRHQPDNFWESVNVFPTIVRGSAGHKDYSAQAISQLRKCGKANLRLLCERAMLATPREATPEQLSAQLLAADRGKSLLLLAEFIRGKGRAINEEYASHFSEIARKKHLSQLGELNRGRIGGLKQFAKLSLLYENDPEAINRIFVRNLWRGTNTTWEFVSPVTHDASFVRKLSKSMKSLADALADAFAGYELQFFATTKIDGWQILLLKREYAPIVRPDYRDTQKTLHGFGWIMFGVEIGKSRILLKGGGRKTLPIVRTWFDQQLKVELHDAEANIVTTYDPNIVESAFLGELSETHPVQIAAISFQRTMAPQHSPMTIEPLFPGHNICRDLVYAKEKGLLRIRSLSDIKWFRLSYENKEATVQVAVDLGGAVTLRVDTTDLSEMEVDAMCDAFERQFSIPLNRRIDPQKLLLGSVDVYNFLLETDRKDGLAHYQLKALKGLIDSDIITVDRRQIIACPKQRFICKLGGQHVVDEDVSECPQCQTPLQSTTVEFLKHNEPKIRSEMAAILANATGWNLSKAPVEFEGQHFYPLSDPTRPDRIIRVYFAKRVGDRVLGSLDRSLQPVLVVHTGGDVEHAHLDAAGVAHISFARALAASVDDEVAARFREDALNARDDLIRRQEEKVHRRAVASRARIGTPPVGYTGEMYQTDVFNVVRSLFPYTEYWTGANRPDGFCCLVSFENASLREPVKHNISYDAKFNKNGSGYDLNSAEKRKEWDYVAAIAKLPELSTQGNESNGHAIISNVLIESQMKDVTKFLRRDHRLGKKHPSVRIVFILDTFLTSLYDNVRSNEHDFRLRWNWLSSRVAHVLNRENSEGFVFLDKGSANEVCQWVLRQREVDTPPRQFTLQQGIHEIMTDS